MNSEIGKKLGALIDKRETLEGARIYGDILNLSTSLYIMDKNYRDLIIQISGYEKDIKIWEVSKRVEFNSFLHELSRLIHNYLSSTFSLINHSSIFCNQLHNKTLRNEYDDKVANLKVYDCYHFVKDLRRFNQHIGLPIIAAQLSMHPQDSNGFQSRILFSKEVLLKWDRKNGWTSRSENYLKTHEEIEVKAVFSEYQQLIKEFYDWFYGKITNKYSKEISEFVENENEIARLSELAFPKDVK